MSHSKDPAGPTISSNVLDVSVFHELVQSLTQPEVVAALYRKFIGNATAFIGGLRDQDAGARGETLHTLKGSAAMMGANRMSELAARLEAQGPSVQVELATQQLSDELEKFRAAAASRLLALGTSLNFPP
jgi:HPt (histidine-containing phosphotransfer) domain-containing protein